MRRECERFRRPLLDVSRADTRESCEAEGLNVWMDPHNEDPRFTRVRVRHKVLPVLETELGPGVAVALARTADLLRPAMELLDDLAHTAYAAADALTVASLASLPAPNPPRPLRLAAIPPGAPGAEHLHQP